MSDALYGHAGIVFMGFDEESSYLEQVTVPNEADALAAFHDHFADWSLEPGDLKTVYMCHVEGEEASEWSEGEFDSAWIECDADHPDAVPFWKECP